MKIAIADFAERLAAIPEREFTDEGVLQFMRANPVAPETLGPYTYFNPAKYTRNLISRTSLFELLALCWDIGQVSTIHNHRNQRCWMGIAVGKVQVQNFRMVKQDPVAQTCELEPTTRFTIEADSPAEVDPEEPIHLVANPAVFGARAVTLHIYSLPFDTCEVYDVKTGTYKDVKLQNHSEFGVKVGQSPP